MRKAYVLFILLVILSGCVDHNQPKPSETPYNEKGMNYEIIDNTKYHRPMFQYFIYGDDNELIVSGVTFTYPEISESEGLLKLCLKSGEYIQCCRYFDVKKKLYSVYFINPLAQNGTLIAYLDIPMGATKLVVQDIFDKTKYYREFSRLFYNEYYPVNYAEFINNGKQLSIKYASSLNGHETETLDLYPVE